VIPAVSLPFTAAAMFTHLLTPSTKLKHELVDNDFGAN
jgi:hypothetical protein